MKKIALIGSTGSIGTQTLDVVRQHPGQFEITGLAAGGNIGLFAEQVNRFRPKKASVATKEPGRAGTPSASGRCAACITGSKD